MTQRSKNTVVLCVAVLLLVAAQAAWSNELVLADKTRDPYRTYKIVIAAEATMQDYHAAEILQRHINEISGVTLPIISGANALGSKEIIVGFNGHLIRVGVKLEKNSFGPEVLP